MAEYSLTQYRRPRGVIKKSFIEEGSPTVLMVALEEKDMVDYHVRLFGKRAEQVIYYEDQVCPICNSRIDEGGWCACGTIGGD